MSVLDLEWLPYEAYDALRAYDESCVGTKRYIGIAYFWNEKYKFELRDATPKQRKKVHDKLLEKRLRLDGTGTQHEKIIRSVVRSGGRHLEKTL